MNKHAKQSSLTRNNKNVGHKNNQTTGNNGIKLKTLPNEIMISDDMHGNMFKSVCDDFSTKINLASPTFATEAALTSISAHTYVQNNLDDNNQENKAPRSHKYRQENGLQDITNLPLSLKQRQKVINTKTKLYDKQPQNMVFPSSVPFDQKSLAENRLVQKCTLLQEQNKSLKQQNYRLSKKLSICTQKLQTKIQKSAIKFKNTYNSSKQYSNVDIYLQMQAFKQDYKQSKIINDQLHKQLVQKSNKIQQLSQAILNYTEKPQSQAKYHRLEQELIAKHSNQIKFLKNKYEDMLSAKDKQLEEIDASYSKLKFLKDQIQKKRAQDLHVRDQLNRKLHAVQTNYTQLKAKQAAGAEKLNKHKEELQQYQLQINQHKKQKEQLRQQYQRLNKQINNLKQQNNSLKTQNKNIQKQYKDMEVEYKNMEEEYEKMQEKLNSNRAQFQQQQKQTGTLIQQLGKENKQLKANQIKLQVKIEELQHQVDSTEKECMEINKKINQLMAEQKGECGECVKAKANYLQAIQTKEKLQTKVEELSIRIKQQAENYKSQQQQLQKIKHELEQKQSHFIQRQSQRSLQTRTHRPLSIHNPKYIQSQVPPQISSMCLPTKSISQLQMIKNTLTLILKHKNNHISSHNNYSETIPETIQQIIHLSEQCADHFDYLANSVFEFKKTVKNKEEIISKILKFIPQEEENMKYVIIEYLRVMDNIQDYSIEEVQEVNLRVRHEYEDWGKKIKVWKKQFAVLEQENYRLRRQLANNNSHYDPPSQYERSNYEQTQYNHTEQSRGRQWCRERDRTMNRRYMQ